MYISNVVIKNFRALQDINFGFRQRVNVIVGPNAVGKTTILQALRLAKALLAPRSNAEAQQTLISLGAVSPHFPQRMFLNALARDLSRPIEIRATYCLTDTEFIQLSSAQPQIARSLALARLAQSFANPAAHVQLLGSPLGQQVEKDAATAISAGIAKLKTDRALLLDLRIEAITGQIRATDAIAGTLVSFLDQRLPPHQSIFTYFPADRALPFGEVNIQLGAADTQQQIESHSSQPQLKYARLKNMIVNSMIMSDVERASLKSEFEKIFKGILKSRRLHSIGMNELGLLSVLTEELDMNRPPIELDNLSSGEKNLVLTFLLIARTIATGGIALFDEPELHLNPAICKEVLTFLLEEYSIPKDVQFLICTHSPEILSGAFSSPYCSLYHVKSPTLISHVGRHAIDEYSDALQKLGTSVSESLLYEGTVLVEGDDDVDFLETGFDVLLRRFKIKDRGGRREVEKTIKKLQELEQAGQQVSPIFLIFDKDEEVTDLRSSQAVRVLQWRWRSMENYLLDLDVITEVMKNSDVADPVVASEGEVSRLLRELAFQQLDEMCSRAVYKSYGYRSPSLHAQDVERKPLDGVAISLFQRMSAAQQSLNFPPEVEWRADFLSRCAEKRRELEPVWESQWKELCDGKRLFADLQQTKRLKKSLSQFKRMIILRMKETSSDNWRLVESALKELILGTVS